MIMTLKTKSCLPIVPKTSIVCTPIPLSNNVVLIFMSSKVDSLLHLVTSLAQCCSDQSYTVV